MFLTSASFDYLQTQKYSKTQHLGVIHEFFIIGFFLSKLLINKDFFLLLYKILIHKF